MDENRNQTHQSHPMVSIIIPAFNHEQYIREAILSILNQGLENFEIIVIDDGSSDDTPKIVAAMDDHNIQLVHQDNRGAAGTLNRGIALASGKYIAILNSDDLFVDKRLHKMMMHLESHPNIDIASSRVQAIDSEGKVIKAGDQYSYWLEWYDEVLSELKQDNSYYITLLKYNFIVSTSNFFFRASLLSKDSFKAFHDSLAYCHDYEFLLRYLKDDNFFLFDEPLLKYRLHPANSIRDNEFLRHLELLFAIYNTVDFETLFSCPDLAMKISHNIYRGLWGNKALNSIPEVDKLNTQLEAKTQQLRQAEQWIKEHIEVNNKLGKRLKKTSEENHIKSKSLAMAGQWLMDFQRQQVKELKKNFTLEAEIDKKAQMINQYQSKLEKMHHEMSKLADQVKEKNTVVSKQEIHLHELKGHIQAYSKQIEQKDNVIINIKAWQQNALQKIDLQNDKLSRQENEIQQLHILTEAFDRKNERLKQQDNKIKELIAANNQLEKRNHDLQSRVTDLRQQGVWIKKLQAHIEGYKEQLENHRVQIQTKDLLLQEIFKSKGWLWLTRFRTIKTKVLVFFGIKKTTSKKSVTAQPALRYQPKDTRQNSATNEQPRVIHVIANFMLGGSTRLVADIFEGLGEKFNQEVITSFIPDPPVYEHIPTQCISANKSVAQIISFLKEKDPEIIHVHYWGECDKPWYEKFFTAARQLQCKTIENVNTPVEPYLDDHVDRYVYVSEYARQFGPADPYKSSVVYPGSNLEMFRRNNVPVPDNVIGMVYRLEPDKLSESSIDVFIEVVRQRPGTRALIIGGGTFLKPYREKVDASGVSDQFEFTGYVPYESLPDYYRRLSVFVAPVWKESFGQVSSFAMMMELPVAGYQVGALSEILGTDECLGKDTAALAGKVIELLDNRSKRIEIGEHNHHRVQDLFSVETMIDHYDTLYRSLLSRAETT